MKYAPADYVPPITGGPLVVHNGSPARARDVLELDRAITALVCGRPSQPVLVGTPLEDEMTYALHTLIPAYVTHVGFGFLVTGAGTIEVTTDDDAHNALCTVATPTGAYADAQWVWMVDRRTVSADGTARALELIDRAVPYVHRFDIGVLDASDSTPIMVYAVRILPLARSATLALT